MKTVFADTVYWVAVLRPNDPWAGLARKARERLGSVRLLTTDEVLVEVLAAFSAGGPETRTRVVRLAQAILTHPDIAVVPQSRDTFLNGLDLYQARQDKHYSLTDCIAMNAMRAARVKEILTNDRHFEQEGFLTLMRG